MKARFFFKLNTGTKFSKNETLINFRNMKFLSYLPSDWRYLCTSEHCFLRLFPATKCAILRNEV